MFKDYLIRDVLPFWLNHAIDTEHGGIMTCVDENGELYDEEKSVWFQGRALYTFASCYNQVEQTDVYLQAAKTIYDFLPRCADESGRLAFTVTRQGNPIQKRRYYFSETFAAIGCCEYYLATGDEQARERAEMWFDIAYRLYRDPSLTTPKFNPETAPYHALSPAMILLATAQVMRQIDRDKYDAIAKEMVPEILLHLTEYGLLENVGKDGAFINTATGRTVNPGHSLEAAWFLMAEGEYQHDPALMQAGKTIIDHAMRYGYKNGGIIAFCDCLGKPAKALEWDMYLWWPQCEAMIAHALAYRLFGEERYRTTLEKLKAFAFSHFADTEHGEWYGYLHYDGTVANRLKGNIFKGPFHLPRMLVLLDKLERGQALL